MLRPALPFVPIWYPSSVKAPGLSHCVSFAVLTVQGWPTTRFGVCSWLLPVPAGPLSPGTLAVTVTR